MVVDALLAQVVEPPLAGDYNDDGVVDAADYTVWRDNLDSNGPLLNETESLGIVDAADYDAWKANFGAVAGTGGGGLSAVPEPASWALGILGCMLTIARAGRRRAMNAE